MGEFRKTYKLQRFERYFERDLKKKQRRKYHCIH